MLFGKKIVKEITVEGMKCMHCAKAVETELKKINGVSSVNVTLENKKVIIISRKELSDEDIKSAVEEAGFTLIG